MRFMILVLACFGGTWTFANTDAVMPWVTNQPQFRSLVIVTNQNGEPAEVNLRAVRPFGSVPSEQEVTMTLEPYAQKVMDTGELFIDMGDGPGFALYISSEAEDVSGAFVVRGTGTTSGDSPAQGNMVDRATASEVIFYDYLTVRKGSGFSGVVTINVGEQAAEVQLSAYQHGQRVATASARIEPNHPWVGTTDDLFPGISGDIYAVASSDQPLIGLSFLFNRFLEPSMANARPVPRVPEAADYEAEVTTILGPTASFDGFVLDDAGNYYGAGGFTQDNLVKIDAEGVVSNIVRGLGGPVHLIQGDNGDLFVSEFNIHRVSRVTLDGQRTTYANGLDAPTSLAFDTDGSLWVANYGRTFQGRTIARVSPEGAVTIALDDPLILAPIDIYFHESGDLLIANQVGARILRATRDGEVTLIDQLPEQGIGHMIYVKGVLYSTAGSRIYRTTLDGQSDVYAGSGVPGLVDGPASSAQFNRPNGIWVAPDQSALLVSTATGGANTNFIRKITLP